MSAPTATQLPTTHVIRIFDRDESRNDLLRSLVLPPRTRVQMPDGSLRIVEKDTGLGTKPLLNETRFLFAGAGVSVLPRDLKAVYLLVQANDARVNGVQKAKLVKELPDPVAFTAEELGNLGQLTMPPIALKRQAPVAVTPSETKPEAAPAPAKAKPPVPAGAEAGPKVAAKPGPKPKAKAAAPAVPVESSAAPASKKAGNPGRSAKAPAPGATAFTMLPNSKVLAWQDWSVEKKAAAFDRLLKFFYGARGVVTEKALNAASPGHLKVELITTDNRADASLDFIPGQGAALKGLALDVSGLAFSIGDGDKAVPVDQWFVEPAGNP